MTKRISRRSFLGGLGAGLLAGPTFASAPETSLRPMARGSDFLKQIQPPVDALIEKARLNGTVGFAVADMASGEILEEHNADTPLPPASVAKALTACYALETLGPGFHFETRLLATGGVVDGIVQGDLVLVGGGDPTLDTDALAAMAARLAATGVVGIEGRFLVWGGALPQLVEIDPLNRPTSATILQFRV